LTCVDFYLCDFDRCDPLVLILYGDVIIFIGCPGQLMMWCPLILAHDVDLRMMEFGRLLLFQGYVPSYSQVVIFFGGSRCCDSMGDNFFTGDKWLIPGLQQVQICR
jgi:hypothetical protein